MGKGVLVKPKGEGVEATRTFAQQRNLANPQEAYLTGDVFDETIALAEGDKPKKSKSAATKASIAIAKEATGYDYAKALFETAIALKPEAVKGADVLEPGVAEIISTSPPTGVGPQWRFLGPAGMPNGQTYGDTRVVVSGRVATAAIDPSNSNHVLCGSAGGGVGEFQSR
jgi:hypothetical protein